MRKTAITLLSILFFTSVALAQRSMEQDPKLNNLAHYEGYEVDETPSLGSYRKAGKGKKPMILIPGLGFGQGIFDDFLEDNKKAYTMYAVTLAGMGNTPPPPMPEGEQASYGAFAWQNIALNDIIKLIDTEGLEKPVIVGHFLNGAQIAFDLARLHPEKIGGIIIIGAEPFRYWNSQTDPKKPATPQERVMGIDKYMAPQWFKTVTEKTWDDNMYLSQHYALDEKVAQEIWDESSRVPVPVMVRYLCEFMAYDLTQHVADITVPMMVMIPSFSEEVINDPNGKYVKPFFIDSWDYVKAKNDQIIFKTVPGARLFVWKDQPKATYDMIREFVKQL